MHVDSIVGPEKILFRNYLLSLSRTCSKLPLGSLVRPIATTIMDVTQPELGNIYTHLYTTTRLSKAEASDSSPTAVNPRRLPRRDAGPQSVLSAVRWNPKVVILGEPGSGKSTLVNYLIIKAAQRILSKEIPPPALPSWQQIEIPFPFEFC